MHIYCSAPTSHEGGVRDHREQYLQEGVEYEVATVKELGASQFCSQLNAAFSSSRMSWDLVFLPDTTCSCCAGSKPTFRA
jgi:hypothetical protein